jgi:hypothetical protein
LVAKNTLREVERRKRAGKWKAWRESHLQLLPVVEVLGQIDFVDGPERGCT